MWNFVDHFNELILSSAPARARQEARPGIKALIGGWKNRFLPSSKNRPSDALESPLPSLEAVRCEGNGNGSQSMIFVCSSPEMAASLRFYFTTPTKGGSDALGMKTMSFDGVKVRSNELMIECPNRQKLMETIATAIQAISHVPILLNAIGKQGVQQATKDHPIPQIYGGLEQLDKDLPRPGETMRSFGPPPALLPGKTRQLPPGRGAR